ncbi:MAG: hypothetical protein Q8K86_08975 [Candidatus Nanopelagicaceae bacterium]|nr:hypothetical protein [Candidatus Nanopelagicaceae bacterium]
MKKILLVLLLSSFLVGCAGRRVKDVIHVQRATLEQYVKHMDEGMTTPEQDRAALKAQLRNWQAVDHYFNKESGPPEIKPEEKPKVQP